MSGQFMEKRVH